MSAVMAGVLTRYGQRVVTLVAAGVVALVVVVTTAIVLLTGGPGQYRITVQFTATPGLYAHNAVTVLGVPTGHVVSLKPRANYVDVVLSIPNNVRIPANAQAVLVAPNPVSDRTVELTPPYTDGSAMKRGATIPLARTVVPLELDQVFESVDTLSKTLGPAGANKNGDLSAALHSFAQLVDGNGANVHDAIVSIAAALPALTKNPGELAKLVTSLDTLTRTLAGRDATLNSLYGDLATVTTQFADERQILASAAANLQLGMQQVTAFIRSNQTNITGSVQKLSGTVAAVMQEQAALIKTFDTAPLGFQNFNRAIDLNAACVSPTGAPHNCAALWGRLDFTKDAPALVAKYCGGSILTSLLPILAWNAKLADASARETTCGATIGALQQRTGPAGSPNTPDLDLAHYLGS